MFLGCLCRTNILTWIVNKFPSIKEILCTTGVSICLAYPKGVKYKSISVLQLVTSIQNIYFDRCAGCLAIYALGFVLRWNTIAIFAPIVPISAFIVTFFIPESPVFLLHKVFTLVLIYLFDTTDPMRFLFVFFNFFPFPLGSSFHDRTKTGVRGFLTTKSRVCSFFSWLLTEIRHPI